MDDSEVRALPPANLKRHSARCGFLLVALAVFLAAAQARADDPMEPYRERFRIGYEKWQAGAVGEALQYWEPIYRELGPERGYRVAYDLARAYETLGDATRAAERYESFLSQVAARRARGETLPPVVEGEEAEARSHRDGLYQRYGRILVPPTTPPETVQIDAAEARLAGFVALVPPGRHTVTFAPGTKGAESRAIDVTAGEIVEVAPSPEAGPPPAPPTPHLPPPVFVDVHHPFGGGWLVAAGGMTAASILAPVIAYSVAQSELSAIRFEHAKPQEEQKSYEEQTAQANGYYAARTAAYVTLAIPFVLGAATGALTAAWFLGTRREVRAVPMRAPASMSASMSVFSTGTGIAVTVRF